MRLYISGLLWPRAGRAVGLMAAAARLILYVTSLSDLTARSWRSVLLLLPGLRYLALSVMELAEFLTLTQVMCCDYGFRSGFGRLYQGEDGEIPKNIFQLVCPSAGSDSSLDGGCKG